MPVYEGVYQSFLQGVSQQTPQEREEGQLGAQINMLSDPVTGLRRRGGVKHHLSIPQMSPESFIDIVDVDGVHRMVVVDTTEGKLHVSSDFKDEVPTWITHEDDYFKSTIGKKTIRTTSARGNYFLVNTEKVPTKEELPITSESRKDPSKYGYFSIRGSSFSKEFEVRVIYPPADIDLSFTTTAHDSQADQASPKHIAEVLHKQLTLSTPINTHMNVTLDGITVALEVKDKTTQGQLTVQSRITGGYVLTSGPSMIPLKTELLGTLPEELDGYTMAVGNIGNSAYYMYNHEERVWREVGKYTKPYRIKNEPRYFYINDSEEVVVTKLGILEREAGDEENNPLPKFIDYGITGISAYQSRLVILSGSYVCMSKTTDFNQFMRTSVTELLDDDAIEISSAALSSAQFEYAIPYNKDLVLISQGEQAVIPANATVLTPKTAVIYPSTSLDLSLAVQPKTAGRSMYYVYQRGAEYYQVGEFIPNTYTEAQYFSQNITDHIPLYAEGVCTSMATSSTNNMVVFCSDTDELLVNQYLWQGDERPLMAFHKWKLPHRVVYTHFLDEFLVLFMDNGSGGLIISTLNVQLNQLVDKPIPYIDNYVYVTIKDGEGRLPKNMPQGDVVAVIYDSEELRHQEVYFTLTDIKVKCPYDGVIALGLRYKSLFTLTPPFIKDESGKVIAGARSTIQQLRMTFKSSGTFDVKVQDTMGVAYDGEGDTAYTWSETILGHTWVNSIGAVVIPCRTRLSSTECSVSTTGTTDMNLVSTEYVLRVASKRRRI